MPRFPFNYIYMPPGPPDLRWDRIEGVSGMHFSELQHTALADSMSRYLVALAGESATAKTPDVKCHLESIVKHTRTLINLWSPYRRKRPPDNKQMNLHHAVLGLFPSDFDRDRLICQLVKHRNDAQHTLTHLRQQGQRGRPQHHEALAVMIREWHVVYLQAGGCGLGCSRSGSSSTAKGPFLELLYAAFQREQDRVPESFTNPNRHALAQAILAALKPQRHHKQ